MIEPNPAVVEGLSGAHLEVTRTPVVWIAEPNYEIEYANPAAMSLFGLSDPEMADPPMATGLTRTGELRSELLQTVARLAAGPDAWSTLGTEPAASIAEIAAGEVDGRKGFWVSVPSPGSLNESQQALLEAGQVATLYYDAVPAHVFMKDVSGRYIGANRAFQETIHKSLDEIFGHTDRDLLGPSSATDLLESYDKAVVASRSVVKFETDLTVNSEVLNFQMVNFPILRRGKVVAIGGVGIDQTARIDQERALAESEAQFRLAFENANYGMAMVSLRGELVRVNHRFCEIWGRPEHDLIGHHVDEFAFNDDDLLTHSAVLRMETDERDAAHFEKQIMRGDGTAALVHMSTAMIRDSEGNPLRAVAHVIDITNWRRLEQRVQHGEKLEALGQLAGGIAHDINNLLGGILGLSEMIGLMLTDRPDIRERCDQLEAAVHKASEFTGRLLAYSRTSTSTREPFDVHAVIEWARSLVARSFGPDIEFRIDLSAVDSTVTGDVSDLESALLNLIMNARDAMPSGGALTIASSNLVALDGDDAQSMLRIDVVDTGTGMTADVKNRAFEPFFTTKERDRGTGLGLASVNTAVHAHGGSIELSSEVGKGTKFTILLPTAEAASASALPERPVSEKELGASVLVVDDDEILREVMVDVLQQAGYQVTHAIDGFRAVELLEGGLKPDLLVFDLMMPRLGGLKLFSKARELHPEIIGILVTGYSIDEQAEQLRSQGVNQILQKPFRRDDLLKIMALSTIA